MIFATVGTHGQPFPRLLDALQRLDTDQDVVIQYGHSAAPNGRTRGIGFMDFTAFVEHMHTADVVVTHAGVGSVLTALAAGQTPVVVPRLHALGEHVDDHQTDLARTLEANGGVIVVWDMAELPAAIARAAQEHRARRGVGNERLHQAVRQALFGP